MDIPGNRDSLGGHISTESLERYHLQSSGEPERETIEDHLSSCQACLDRNHAVRAYLKRVQSGRTRDNLIGDYPEEPGKSRVKRRDSRRH